MIWCLLAAALFGASTPAAKSVVDELGPFALAGLLYLGAALAVAPAAARERAVPTRKNVWRLAGAVVFGGIAGPVLLLAGLGQAPASSVALWLNLETPATAFFAWLMFREHLSRTAAVAVLLVIVASLLLTVPFDLGTVGAALLVGAACLCWGLDNNFTAVIDGFTPSQTTFVKGAVAGVTNLLLGLILSRGALAVDLATVGVALGIGAAGYGVSLVLYVKGAQQLGATRSQALFASSPFWGVVLAWVALGEPVLPLQVVAAALMFAAVWLVNRERHDHFHTHEAERHTHWHRHDDDHHDHAHRPEDARTAGGWHCHEHAHEPLAHRHPHRPDLHHRHAHAEPKHSEPEHPESS